MSSICLYCAVPTVGLVESHAWGAWLGHWGEANRNAACTVPSFSGISSAMFVLWGIKSAELHKTQFLFPNVFPNVCEIWEWQRNVTWETDFSPSFIEQHSSDRSCLLLLPFLLMQLCNLNPEQNAIVLPSHLHLQNDLQGLSNHTETHQSGVREYREDGIQN